MRWWWRSKIGCCTLIPSLKNQLINSVQNILDMCSCKYGHLWSNFLTLWVWEVIERYVFKMTCYLTSMPHWGHLSSQYEIALPILIKWQFKQGSLWSVWILTWFNTFIGDSEHFSNFFSEFFDSANSCITLTSSRVSERIIFSSLISFWSELSCLYCARAAQKQMKIPITIIIQMKILKK